LTKKLDLAEDTLRQAAASPRADARVRQNLALVLALEGKFAKAEEVSRQDMSAEAAAANIRAIRAMIAQSDTWKTLRSSVSKKRLKDESAPLAPASEPSG
jgi:Flp pilus assembly protein TadD